MACHSDSDELSEDDNVHNLVDDSGTTSWPVSSPEVGPSVDVMNKFWKRVAELTTRYHDNEGRTCIIDEDHPSCRACRDIKIGCDRKTQFIFDMTKDEFFPVYDQFMKVFTDRDPAQVKKLKQAENAFRSSSRSKDVLNTRRGLRKLGRRNDAERQVVELQNRLDSITAELERTKAREAALLEREKELIKDSSQHTATSRKATYMVGLISGHLFHVTKTARDLMSSIQTVKNRQERVGPATSSALDMATRLVEDVNIMADGIENINRPKNAH
ncbi:hypothetical protein B0H13DRAFT_195416 [Mycena leptocephala]|nr:hypothetical protein B0H13DRAFT_195416 [Mycena leptocephala]